MTDQLRRISPRILQADAVTAEHVCGRGGTWREHRIEAVLYVGHGKRLPYATELRVLSLPIGNDDYVPIRLYDLAVYFHRHTSVTQHTLVHCNAGINRSVAFAALLLGSDCSPQDVAGALEVVRRGPNYPTEPLCKSLLAWDEHNRERRALLRKAGVEL